MKLINFKARDVHDYLDFNVSFREDVNFIAGLNGCGKTTALNMIVAMLTPSFDTLFNMQFSSAFLSLKHNNEVVSISCEHNGKELFVQIDRDGSYYSDLVVTVDMVYKFQHRSLFFQFEEDTTYKFINELPSPMYLSLDRRFTDSYNDGDEFSDSFESDISKLGDDSLNEVFELISKENRFAKAIQSNVEKRLRNNIILDAMEFSQGSQSSSFPDRETIAELRKKQEAVKKTLEALEIPSQAFESKYEKFFKNLDVLSRRIEVEQSFDINNFDKESHEILYSWLVNQNQLSRIDRLFSLVQKYQNEKKRAYREQDRFILLVNNFLKEIEKEIKVGNMGEVKLVIKGKERNVCALSSGERQIIIMIGHLVLNKKLPKNGVFIVDEPELSLHLAWQDMFLESIQAANPNLQIVLATHSPAIIGARNEMFVPLNG